MTFDEENQMIWRFVRNSGIGLTLLTLALLAGCPQYNVYSQRLAGEAKLRESESSRQIAIEEAKAAKESATLLAEAEVIRAKGSAEANKILQDSLVGPGATNYLAYRQIEALDQKKAQLIYVPTEAGLPVNEASRLAPRAVKVEE